MGSISVSGSGNNVVAGNNYASLYAGVGKEHADVLKDIVERARLIIDESSSSKKDVAKAVLVGAGSTTDVGSCLTVVETAMSLADRGIEAGERAVGVGERAGILAAKMYIYLQGLHQAAPWLVDHLHRFSQ